MAITGMVGAASGLFMTIFRVIIIILVAGAGFFGTRFYFKRRNHMKNFNIKTTVTNPDGSHLVCKIGKFKDKDGMQKMLFLREVPAWFGFKSWQVWKGESMSVINPKNIVSLSAQLFRYGPSQYAVIPPTVYRDLDITKFKIQLINMHMLEFKGLEQRAGISRWAAIKKTMQDLAPWITIGIIAICAGVSIYFIVKMGMTEFSKVAAMRVAECKGLIGGGSAPIS
jgi:uncharacterized membrane protein